MDGGAEARSCSLGILAEELQQFWAIVHVDVQRVEDSRLFGHTFNIMQRDCAAYCWRFLRPFPHCRAG